MSLSILWEHIRKIWEKGRGYKLSEILEETNERKKAIFIKGETKAFVLATSKQVSVTLMRKSIEEAKTLECQEIMIATLNKVTPQANQLARKKGVEIIDKNAPLIYIFDHWMVPEHRVLSKKEAKEIIEKYAGGNPNLLPKILVTDPAVRILKAKPGDVIEIIRRIPSKEELVKKYGKHHGEKIYELLRILTPAGEEKSYRLVIEAPEEYLY